MARVEYLRGWGILCAMVIKSTDYCSFAFPVLSCLRIGTSGSASFQRVRKSLRAASRRTRAASVFAPCEVLDANAFAHATRWSYRA